MGYLCSFNRIMNLDMGVEGQVIVLYVVVILYEGICLEEGCVHNTAGKFPIEIDFTINKRRESHETAIRLLSSCRMVIWM